MLIFLEEKPWDPTPVKIKRWDISSDFTDIKLLPRSKFVLRISLDIADFYQAF